MTTLAQKIAMKSLGLSAPESSESSSPMNPIISSMLKQFGITPEAIASYAEGIKGAVLGKLESIDSQLQIMATAQIEISARLAVIETHVLFNKDEREQIAQVEEQIKLSDEFKSQEFNHGGS